MDIPSPWLIRIHASITFLSGMLPEKIGATTVSCLISRKTISAFADVMKDGETNLPAIFEEKNSVYKGGQAYDT